MADKEVIVNYPRERIISLMHEAKFPKHDFEAVYVGNIVFNYTRTVDILPDITNPKQDDKDLASRYLLAAGFFREKLVHLWKYHGGPSLDYFMQTTRRRLIEIGKRDVAENTKNWANHLHDNFQLKPEENKEITPVHTYETSRFHKTFANSLAWKGLGYLGNSYSLGDLKDSSEPESLGMN